MRFKIEGISDVKAELAKIEQKLIENVDDAVERRALQMVNDTRLSAPRKTGKLITSIDIITQDTKKMSRSYGTNVEYASIQEYEHKTKRGFFRNTITAHEPLLIKDVKQAVKNSIKG